MLEPGASFEAERVTAELRKVEEHLRAMVASPADGRGLACASEVFPVGWLRSRLALSITEERVLWVLTAYELCPDARRWLRELGTEDVADPTLDAIRRAVYGGAPNANAWRELSPDGALWRLGLLERIDGNPHVPQHRQMIRLAPRVIALAHGEVALDRDVASFARIDAAETPVDELAASPEAVAAIEAAMTGGLVILRGGAGTGRRSLLVALAHARGHRVLVIEGGALATDREAAARQLRIAARECALFGLVPLVRQIETLGGSGGVPDRLDLLESELSGLVLATTTRPIARRWNHAPVFVELPALTGAQRAKLWQRALPPASPGDADVLATMYPLAPALIRAASVVAMRQCGSDPMKPEHIQAGVRSVLDNRLAGLATRITCTQTWDDLVLPGEQTTALVELLARIRERRLVYEDWGFAQKLGKGLGVSALFSGPPGTGKTMCAGLLAGDLGTELYQVDLSKLTSKWIGETEKNLAALFDAAEAGHAILLFDEADALFGKRTEVRSSNDRHANQETNYLLQRLETFAGICILTTNHEAAIDEAFRRRLSVHVRFPMPEADERVRLWQALIPRTAPVARELGFDQLGEAYVMSGGYIRNAVLRAAFLAADQRTSIDGPLLARAAQLEYEAMGKVVARHWQPAARVVEAAAMSQSSIASRCIACIIATGLAAAGCREDPEVPAGLEHWLADWETARACLLPSAYDHTPTSVAITALSGTRPDCETALGALQVRAPLGGDAITALWRDAIASAAAIELADPPAVTGDTIDHVDRSAAILRLAFAMPPVVREYQKGPRRLGRGRTLMIAGAELTADVPLTLQRNAIAGRLTSGAQIVDFFGTSLETVRTFPHAVGSAAVYPGGGAVEGSALGAMEIDGVRLVIRAAPPGAAYAYAVEVTTKTGVRRHLVDRTHGELVEVSQTPLTGHLFVLMYEPGPAGGLRVHHYPLHSRSAALGKPAPASAPRPGPWTPGARIDCRVDRLGWSLAGDQLYLVNTERSYPVPLAHAEKERSIDCAGGAAIVLAHGPDHLELCEDLDGCASVHRPKHGRRGVAAVLPDGGWIYAAELEGVVGVWRGYLPVRFFRLAAPARLVGIVVLEHTEYLVVVEADRRYRFVPLPPTQI